MEQGIVYLPVADSTEYSEHFSKYNESIAALTTCIFLEKSLNGTLFLVIVIALFDETPDCLIRME
ncbi:hypothetical protein T4B_14508 [Trichinella pseudospiralis]|uniref:Uncharacterized protein n=1 Tax=Trichinella pseudospiralis TaxID=6337 RepID=A0A0V1GT11_TRIPS|nr:hypothetical protein T4B_14508 [Trichinella pseudospiralis]